MASYNPEGAKVYEKTDGHKFGRIKGKWEDAMRSAAPNDNERGWNQAAQEAVADGHIDTQAEVDQAAAWLKGQGDEKPEEAPVTTAPVAAIEEQPVEDSPHLAEAKERVTQWENKSWSGERANEIFGKGSQPTQYDFTNSNYLTQSNKATELLDQYKTGFANTTSAADQNNENALQIAMPDIQKSASPVAQFSSAHQ